MLVPELQASLTTITSPALEGWQKQCWSEGSWFKLVQKCQLQNRSCSCGNTQARKKKVCTIQRPQNAYSGLVFSFTKQYKRQWTKCLCSQGREVHCSKDPFKLYCDAVALLRSYSPPVLVSGNIPVRNSHLLMTLLNVIHIISLCILTDAIPFLFNRNILYNCKVISLQHDATIVNLRTLSPLTLSPLRRTGKHRKAFLPYMTYI